MTPTPEGKQLAADLANAVRRERGEHTIWNGGDFEARYGTVHEAFARLATEHLALKTKHEEALADLREIWLIARRTAGNNDYRLIETIAAKWRVETDPLLIEARKLAVDCGVLSGKFREELLIGKHDAGHSVQLALAALKRGYEIGRKS